MSVAEHAAPEPGPTSSVADLAVPAPPARLASLRLVAPGLGLASAIALVATVVAGWAPVAGAPLIAIVLGIAISVVLKPRAALRPGITFVSKKVLQASVIILGFGLSLSQVLSTGGRSLPVLLGTLVAALAMAWIAGRLLRLRSDLKLLIGVGTAVCGASAIAATSSVIDAEEADVSYAIATIFTFNVVAVLLFPLLGHALGLSQYSFGLWSGTAVNDLSSVVAASTVYGHAAASYGVIVKLTRTLAIIPICLGLAAWRGARHRQSESGSGGHLDLRRVFPLFIIGFAAAVVANTVGVVPHSWHHPLSDTATWMITAALAAIGLSTDVGRIRRAGLRPLVLGAILWATVGLTSLALQAATGTL